MKVKNLLLEKISKINQRLARLIRIKKTYVNNIRNERIYYRS